MWARTSHARAVDGSRGSIGCLAKSLHQERGIGGGLNEDHDKGPQLVETRTKYTSEGENCGCVRLA